MGTDGHALAGGESITAPLSLAAAERLDIEFVAPDGIWSLHAHDPGLSASGLRVPMLAPGVSVPAPLPDTSWDSTEPPLDLARYTSSVTPGPAPSGPARSFLLHLGERMGGGGSMGGMSGMGSDMQMGGMAFTINGATFPATAPLRVDRGDVVTLTFKNDGMFVHPMHLHGHAFTVLSVDGRAYASAMLKDTVAVQPGSAVTVRFIADNPGIWMIHCHELHHAAAGMDTLLEYNGARRLANLPGPGGAVPE